MSKMIANALGRLVPTEVVGLGEFAPFTGAFDRLRGDYSYAPFPPASVTRSPKACAKPSSGRVLKMA